MNWGVVKRRRKIDLIALIWTLVLDFKEDEQRSLNGLRKRFMNSTCQTIAASSWRERFTPQLSRLMRECLQKAISIQYQEDSSNDLPGKLKFFEEILTLDAAVLRLHQSFAEKFPASRTNHTKAAAKLHTVINVCSHKLTKVKVCEESCSDQKSWKRLGPWLHRRLLMTDLGYYDFNFFRRIENNGGYFLTRLKSNTNPFIITDHGIGPGRCRDIQGLSLQEAIDGLKRETVKVTAQFSARKRVHRGKRREVHCDWRVVAIRNEEEDRYHLYPTNIPRDLLNASEIGEMYRLRWQVEIYFKMLKSHGRIQHLKTQNKATVEILIWASLLAAVASMKTHRWVKSKAGKRRVPVLRFQKLFSNLAVDLLTMIIRKRGIQPQSSSMEILIYESIDPNKNRLTILELLGLP